MTDSDTIVISRNDAHQYIQQCLLAAGATQSHAQIAAEVLIEADYRGHFSHGINRLECYIEELRRGVCANEGEPEILKSHGATAWVDGRNLLGAVVGEFGMKLAMEKAKEFGIGIVTCKNSNHYGIAGYYSMMAMKEGLIGISMTNSNKCAFPCRSSEMAMGTNPLAFFAGPVHKQQENFELDMATTTVAYGKVELAERKGETTIPSTWAADEHGKPTTSTHAALNGGGVLPLGGAEQTGGYKGWGLALMVEILTASLSDSATGSNMRPFMVYDQGPANVGHCFLAIDPTVFAPDFDRRMGDMIRTFRELPTIDGVPMRIAGDPEHEHMTDCDQLQGIPYHINTIEYANQLGAVFGIAPMKAVVPQ